MDPARGPRPGTEDPEDEWLVRRARAGDVAAFGILYERHVGSVYAYVAHQVGSRGDAEDLTEEVFHKVLAGLDGFRWRGSLRPWLLTIARHAVVDHWRLRVRTPDGPVPEVPAEGDDPEEAAARAEERECVRAALRRLTELQRQVIGLRFGAGLSVQETARAMRKNENAIKNLQFKAVAALQRILEGRRL